MWSLSTWRRSTIFSISHWKSTITWKLEKESSGSIHILQTSAIKLYVGYAWVMIWKVGTSATTKSIFFVGLFFAKRVTARDADLREAELNATLTTTADEAASLTSKPCIYLTQNEQCLPQYLASSTRIGDSKTCNCDLIVLSCKEECQDEKASLISYAFAKENTCTTGRNLLYFVAIERIRHNYY